MPPITIDGQQVQEVTIDGQQVKEVTIDGQVAFQSNSLPVRADLLKVWYRFFQSAPRADSANGSDFYDSTAQNLDSSSGYVGTGVDGDGSFKIGSNLVDSSNLISLDSNSGGISWSCWLFVDGDLRNLSGDYVFRFNSGKKDNFGLSLGERPGTDITYEWSDDAGAQFAASQSFNQQWVHIAGTASDTSGGNNPTTKIFFNGSKKDTAVPPGDPDVNGSGSFRLNNISGNGLNSNCLADDVRLYQGELLESDVSDIYTRTKP